jgi:hypothetical protein
MDVVNKVNHDRTTSQRKILSENDAILNPKAEIYRKGTSTADVLLTWNSQGLEMVEAVAIDGIITECSVDNSEWRKLQGVGVNMQISTCDRSCYEVGWVGGNGRKCVLMNLALGRTYDVLIGKLTPSAPVMAVRITAPWVHHAGKCRISEGKATTCGGKDIVWQGGLLSMGGAMQMSDGTNIEPSDHTSDDVGVSFATTRARPSTDMADLVFLSLDRGMRVTRIVTVTTVSDAAIKVLRMAKTRAEVMIICRQTYAESCVLTEHMQLPATIDSEHHGWGYEQKKGSSVRANSGVPGSVLWTADISKEDCHLSVGSWLLGSVSLENENGVQALFSRSISQACAAPQGMVLIKPGFAWPQLIRGTNSMEWSMTFIELQNIDELGVPVRRG